MAIDFNVGTIEEACNRFLAIPQDVHLLCPKVGEDDDEDYDDLDEPGAIGVDEKKKRLQDHKNRVALVYRSSLIFGFPEEDAGGLQDTFRTRTGAFLTSCAPCVRNWHRNRKPFLKHLSENEDEYVVEEMQNRLNKFDADRITMGLEGAKTFIDSHQGIVEQRTFIEEDRSDLLVALYEALCCITYLSVPENRAHFNYVFAQVQQKRPLKLAEVLPTMTHFLFDESSEEKTRLAFAKVSWSRMPEISPSDFDWAVKDSLEAAIRKVAAGGISFAQVQRFWEGFGMILNALGEDIVVSALGSLNVQPSIYQMMLTHMAVGTEANLAAVLKVFNMLLQKGPRGLWGHFEAFSPTSVAEPVFASPNFRSLLTQTREFAVSIPEDKYLKGPVAVAWVKPFIESIPPSQKGDACDSILHHLLDDFARDNSLSLEGRLACYQGSADVLLITLNAYLSPNYKLNAGASSISTNRVLNLVVKYKDVFIGMTKLDRQQDTLSRAARSVIGSALTLDSLVTAEEFHEYSNNRDLRVQREVAKKSSELWEAFLELLVPGAIELAKVVLSAVGRRISVEQLRPPKKEQLSAAKQSFNASLSLTIESIGKIIDNISEFSLPDLNQLLLDSDVIQPLVSVLLNGETSINQAGLALIQKVTDEEQSRSDAVARLLTSHFSPLLLSFSKVTSEIISSRLWSPQNQVLLYSNDILDGLCDPAFGILRSKSLNNSERAALNEWWSMQWAYISAAFEGLDPWSRAVDTETMKNFCRGTMEYADALLAQDGLISSALGFQSEDDDLSATMSSSNVSLKGILKPPRDKCMGMAKMLRLKDKWLVHVTVNVLCKLLRRLTENDMEVPQPVFDYIQKTCVKNAQGKYDIPTNLNDQQRAELMRSLGEDEDEIEIVEVKRAEPPKRQSKIDAWSKSGDGISSSGSGTQSSLSKSSQDVFRELTPAAEKNRSVLQQMKARHAKPEAKPSPARTSTPLLDAANIAKIKENRLKEQEAKRKRDAEAVARAKALRAPKSIVSGEGSGLQGLSGVQGKDHAPRGEMLVDSSSEDEGDSDDEAAFLAQTQAGKKRAEAAASRVMGLKSQVRAAVKKNKIQRSAKDMRARLIPPMDVLHQAILDWDIFHEGNDPPNGIACSKVSTTYSDPRQYKETFLPLLIYEAWRSFATAKDETTSQPFGVKVMNRMNVDKFVEVTTLMPLKKDSKDDLSEGDIVLLSVAARPLEGRGDPHCLARIWRIQNKHGSREVSYRISGKAGPIIPLIAPKVELYAVKITNMRTIEREFASLESLQYYDLMQEILEAKPSPMLNFSEEAIAKVMANYHLNRGQAKATLHAKENDAFTLVQGPPGTGKTKTIVAMVGTLLSGVFSANTGTAIRKPGQSGPPSAQATSKKLLVCAPSNAAVDELVLRLKQGVKSYSGTFHKINVLRLGRSEAINAAVKDVTLDELVRLRLEGDASKESGPTDRQKMHEEAGQIKEELSELRPMLDAARASDDRNRVNELQRKFEVLKRRQNAIGAKIQADKDSGNTAQRESEIRRRQVQQEIIDSAHVLCATLSGAGHETLKNLNVEFETVIIDEAAQCVELSALIPLKYGCSKCILVGDPKQLPPTVLSQSAQRYGYDQSLFVRMQQNHPADVHLLDHQYRMHPEISMFPSQEFYEGKLADGDDMAKLRYQPWHRTNLLGPYRFFDVKGSQEKGRKGQSLVNIEELKVAMHLYKRFKTINSGVDLKGKIGIITPYKAQLFELRERFAARYGPDITQEIEFNTTDAFQGRECEIIIFSCVRASPTGGIGFMTDIRRMNVGLTRAKSSLWILGDSRALVQGEFWNKLIENAKARDRYTSGDIISQLNKSGPTLPAPSFSEKPSFTNNITKPNPDKMEVDEIDMKEIPLAQPSSFHHKVSQLHETYTLLERPAPPSEKFNSVSAKLPDIDKKVDLKPIEAANVASDPPVTHPSGGHKRPREGSLDGDQPVKRATPGFLPGKSAPSKPKTMPRPADPSAADGLNNANQAPPPGASGVKKPVPRPPAPKGNPLIPPKKKAANPFISRKPTR
ncbi:SEN1 N terminal-domain-containing protein [Xylariales sp. PMI_506]|nr:SEN1 N terminal-domain-containing protein [Xylariales sp. PMI_506]